MKNTVLLFSTVLAVTLSLAQQPAAQPKVDVELSLRGQAGSNGTAVAWNPEKRLYYAVMAGNEDYPLETYREDGGVLYSSNAGFDFRGLWWNPRESRLEGNGFASNGWRAVYLDSRGMASENGEPIVSGGWAQPFEQSVGDYDPLKKEVVYYHEGNIYRYKAKNGKERRPIPVQIEDFTTINPVSIIATGVDDYKYGLLEYDARKVLLFNKRGELAGEVPVPVEFELQPAFSFSYANGRVFVYDKSNRRWSGFRLFESY